MYAYVFVENEFVMVVVMVMCCVQIPKGQSSNGKMYPTFMSSRINSAASKTRMVLGSADMCVMNTNVHSSAYPTCPIYA